MPLKVAVLGAGGMLGHKMLQHLRPVYPGTVGILRGSCVPPWLAGEVRTGVDAGRFEDLAAVLRGLRPDYMVNCMGIVKQRPEARDAVASIEINSLLPHRLAALGGEWGGRLIHFSTDCVFRGDRGSYGEEDLPDATDLYGRSKALGEVETGNALTLRTSIIGRELRERRSLLEWFLSHSGRPVRGFRRVIWSGITTNCAARLVEEILARHAGLSGLFQASGGRISKYDLLCLLRDAYSPGTEVVPDDDECSDRSLLGDKLHQATGWLAPDYPAMIREMAADTTPYESGLKQ